MRDVRDSNQKIFEKYKIISEAKNGARKKVQILEDQIDDFMDQLEKQVDEIKENPVFQKRMYQMIANMVKEHGEFIMALKTVAKTLDSGAKVIPTRTPSMKDKEFGNNEPQEQPEQEEESVNEE